MVIVIVIFGLTFSAIQFYISMIKAKHSVMQKSQERIEPKGETDTTTLKISAKGLEVNSSVLGIIILVLSLAFFYLYLIYVYPVTEYNIENKTPKVLIDETSKDNSN